MTVAPSTLVTIEDVRRAAAMLRGVAVRTPLLASESLQALSGTPVWLKPEMLQRAGAFKFRGGYTYLASMSPEARARGVITASSGNHGQAVALAARMFGVPSTIVMPTTVPAAKQRGAERLATRCYYVGTTTAERIAKAEELCAAEGLTYVPPFDDPTIIAAQGTVGLEIAEDLPRVGTVLVQVGGGGLSSGVAIAIKALAPNARVIGVEPELAADAQASLAAGHIVRWEAEQVSRTIADGTRTQAIGRLNFAHLSTQLDRIVTVSEAEIAAGVRLAAEEARLVIEPSGALTVAAMRFHARELGLDPADGPIVGVVSGGNVDPDRYLEYLAAPVPPEA